VKSAELLKGARQIVILHDGREYRLHLTKNGKLILTK
jgi:hemin uptake protein HemP